MSKKQDNDTNEEKQITKETQVKGKPAQNPEEKLSLKDRIISYKEYLVLCRAELLKVSWPSWKETRTTSLVVLGFVAVMAILLGIVDLILSGIIRFILA